VTAGKAVFDASAILRAVLGLSPTAVAALSQGRTRLAPDLVYLESANALRRYCRAEIYSLSQAGALLEDITRLPIQVSAAKALAPAALTIAHERGLSAYDACYVALAEAADAPLVTADRKLAAAYERSELVA